MTHAFLQREPQADGGVSHLVLPSSPSISPITENFQIGMPNLSLGGLSENWLLKECGHRHWIALATMLRLATTDFRDVDGNRLYAAFTAVRVCDGQLGRVSEGDELRIVTSLARCSRTQWFSSQKVLCNERRIARVAMGSVFLRRRVTGSNRHVERATVAGSQAWPGEAFWPGEALDDMGLLESARLLRSGNWQRHFGFERMGAGEIADFSFRPCPNSDFNGADFLYFASFQSIVDRAEWQWTEKGRSPSVTKHREIFYYANIDVGDDLRVVLRGRRPNAEGFWGRGFSHWCQVYRASDERLIADVFTEKAPRSRR
jgi:probable biosynthetic protein (TIGR04099 family)